MSLLRAIGLLALMGFVLFVAFRIHTPPAKTVQIVAAPDGRLEARLQHVYYTSVPGYKISVRSLPDGGASLLNRWRTLAYLPGEIPNLPAGGKRVERLRWGTGSARLYFEIDGVAVWGAEL